MASLQTHLHRETQNFSQLVHGQTERQTVEGVHDLRVSTRRLRSLLWLIQFLDPTAEDKNLEKSLKKLAKHLGKVRQLDVLSKDARHFDFKNKKILKPKQKEHRSLAKFLKKQDLKVLLADLDHAARRAALIKSSRAGLSKKLQSDLQPWLKRKIKKPVDYHQLRIRAKKTRYIFEALDLPTEALKELQDVLGKFHDLQVLQDYFKKKKSVSKAEKKQLKKANKLIRPALRSSIEIAESLH